LPWLLRVRAQALLSILSVAGTPTFLLYGRNILDVLLPLSVLPFLFLLIRRAIARFSFSRS
jgi:hypothetical protein